MQNHPFLGHRTTQHFSIYKFIAALLAAASLFAPVAFAVGGGTGRNGGDAYALEFTTLARLIGESLANRSLKLDTIDAAKFNSQVETVKVSSIDKAILDTVEVDAINYPSENRIEISRIRWKEYEGNPKKKLSLILHEILGVMSIDDGHYQISSKFLAQIEQDVDELISTPASENWFKVVANSPARVPYCRRSRYRA